MSKNIFFFLVLFSGLLIYANPNITRAVTGEIPTIYDDLYLVPFSEDNPAPIEETAPEPTLINEPVPVVEPAPIEPAPAKTISAPAADSQGQAQTSAPQNQSQTADSQSQAPATTETENAVTNTETVSDSGLAEATTEPILAQIFEQPIAQVKMAVKKIGQATADNKITKNLPTPRSMEFTPATAKRQINLSVWLFILVGLSATVLNELVKKINESPNRFNAWWSSKTGHYHKLTTNKPLIRKILVISGLLFYGVLIVISETPDTWGAGLATLVPVLAVVTVFLLIKEGGEKIFLARGGADCFLVFSGLGALVLVLGIVLSRNIHLLPPLILSAPLALTVLKHSQIKEEAVKIKSIILTLAVVATFWLSSYFNNPIWQGAALLVCAVGIQDIFFSLIPLNPLFGYELFKNRLTTWIILFILATSGFVFLILAPNSSSGNLNVSWTSAVIYAGVTIAIWLSLRMNSRRTSTK